MHVLFSLFFSWESALLALSFHLSAVFSISYSNSMSQKPKNSSGNEKNCVPVKGDWYREDVEQSKWQSLLAFSCFVCTELWIHLLIFLPHQWLRCGHFSYTLQYNEEERHTKPSIIILYETYTMVELGSPGGSDSRKSACNAGDLGLIPGSGSSPGEGIGYPLQYSLASLVAQTVKNPPAMQETRARFLGQEVPLERGMATYSISNLSSLAWRIPQTQPGCLQASLWLCLLSLLLSCPRRGGHDWVNSTFTFMTELCEGHSEDIS